MNKLQLTKQWEKEEKFAFQGWDFSHLDSRWESPELPWDYRAIIKKYLKNTDKLLDMGTGGGEFLLKLNHPYENTYVTEAYPPNFELCKNVLSPLGVTVVQTNTDDNLNADDILPFDNGFFDFIINRHESFDLSEVNRTLKHGGYFITQQIGNMNSRDLMKRFDYDDSPVHFHELKNYTDTLERFGYNVIKTDEIKFPVKFLDVGAFVYYAKIIVWEFPKFSVNTHLNKLFDCQKEIEEKGFFEKIGHQFLIVAKKI